MACRCLFSTRCLHTWLDPRGIPEMFLAPIRNHILLLSSLSLLPLPPSLFLVFHSLGRPSRSYLLTIPSSRRGCRVCRPRPPIVDVDDIATRVLSSFPPRLYRRKFVSVPVYLFPRAALTLARRTSTYPLPLSVPCPRRRVCRAKARANVLIIILDGRN